MDRIQLLSWMYGNTTEAQATDCYTRLKLGVEQGKPFPFTCPHQVALVHNLAASEEWMVAILVMLGTPGDDSVEQYKELEKWAESCGAELGQDRVGVSPVLGGSIQEALDRKYSWPKEYLANFGTISGPISEHLSLLTPPPISERKLATLGGPTGKTCWFCKNATSDPTAACHIPMYGNVESSSIPYGGTVKERTTWNTTSIDVPRCSACKAVHTRHRKAGSLGAVGLLGIGLGLIILVFGVIGALTQGDGLFAVLAVAILLVLLSASAALIWASRQRALRDRAERISLGMEGETYEEQYPQVQALLAAGWKIGGR